MLSLNIIVYRHIYNAATSMTPVGIFIFARGDSTFLYPLVTLGSRLS